MNLGKVEFEKKLAVKDGQAFAVVEETGNFEKIKGCEYFADLRKRDREIQIELVDLQNQIAKLENEQELNKSQMLDLEKAGYCDLSEKVFKRFGGAVVAEEYGHKKTCQHKGE